MLLTVFASLENKLSMLSICWFGEDSVLTTHGAMDTYLSPQTQGKLEIEHTDVTTHPHLHEARDVLEEFAEIYSGDNAKARGEL